VFVWAFARDGIFEEIFEMTIKTTNQSKMKMSRRTFGGGLAAAALAGTAPPLMGALNLNTVHQALDAHIGRGNVPGLVALVARGLSVDVHVAGVRDIQSGAPMQRDTIFAVASIGKPITAVSALILVEEGVLDLDEPVDKWLPELANRRVIRSLEADLNDTVPARRLITLRDILTMRMGLGAVFADPASSPLLKRMAELELTPGPKLFGHSADEYMRRIGSLPLVHHPGERWLYHTGMDVAGILVERASGKKLGDFQRERIFEPLGMKDTGFWVPQQQAQRLATCYWRKPETNELQVWNPASGSSFLEPPPFESGGGGHVSTVDDFRAFGRLLLGRGLYGNKRILQESTVAEMVRDQISEEVKDASPFFPGFWDTHGWGLGIAVITTPDHISSRPGRFGWWGGFGTTFFADPNSDTVALLFTQRMMGSADDTKMSEEFLKLAFSQG
jgi:CubicO group peptidase (beta-lactamase class C family)